jgi:hypothetical protein
MDIFWSLDVVVIGYSEMSHAGGFQGGFYSLAGGFLYLQYFQGQKHHCRVGYSDYHNLMGFTSKKMPNNIL